MDFDWNWRLKPYDRQKAYELTQKLGILPVTARLLTQRGIKNAPEAYQYLYGGLKDLEDPLVLGGMDRAVARINRCIDAREKVMVYGDYDVDGICSMVLLLQALKKLGCQADYYVPDRFSEGYGLNLPAVEEIAQKGYQLLITVDCGISSCEEVETANRLGMDVIITDHHSPSQVLPEAFAVINPKLKARESTKDLAGVGVVFKLVQSLMESRAMAEDVYEWLDLVALATIADVVPLLGENRIFVKYGLKQMAHTNSLGLKALIKKAGLEGRPLTPWHIGFILAPRLNSAGRLENADLAVELLLTQDYAQAEELAGSLCQLNQERKSIEDKVFQEAVQQVTGGKEKELPPVLVLAQEAWHPGVLGIVASKIADKYQRPAILISWDGEEGRGSCRSIEGFDIYEALYNCREYLVKFGGHKLAAGLTIKRNSFEDFINAMCLQGQDHLAVGAGKEQMADLLLDLDEISYRLMDELKMLEPFGEGNPTPRFITKSAEVREPLLVGKNQEHFKCHIGGIFPGIAFFSGPHLLNSPYNESLHDLVYKLEKKEFNNREYIQLNIAGIKCSLGSDNYKCAIDSGQGPMETTIKELACKRPVVYVYPTVRSLVKDLTYLEYFLLPGKISILNGHMSPQERKIVENQLESGYNQLFLLTEAAMQCFLAKRSLPGKLKIIFVIWPDQQSITWLPEKKQQIVCEITRSPVKLHWQRTGPGFADSHRIMVYTNRQVTVAKLSAMNHQVFVEAGIKNVQQRKKMRRSFRDVPCGLLLVDGAFGGEAVDLIDELVFADVPFGRFEAISLINQISTGNQLPVRALFGSQDFTKNREWLNRQYPDFDLVRKVLGYFKKLGQSSIVADISDLAQGLGIYLERPFNGNELLPILDILADLDLCQIKKRGSIIAIKFLKTGEKYLDIGRSMYYLEGLAEKLCFDRWEKELKELAIW